MKELLAILILLISFNTIAWASPNDAVSPSNQSQISVVVFMNKKILEDSKAVAKIRDVLKQKFNYASSVVIYGDNQAKTPEFLEFTDKIQTDPANEKSIRTINIGDLSKYGEAVKSDYVILITISPCNAYMNFWSGIRIDMKENISVIDVPSQKYVEYLNWYKEGSSPMQADGAKELINKLATDFLWSPPSEKLDKNSTSQLEEKKSSVVVFLPDVILEKPDLVEKVKKSVSEKFNVSNVPVYVDDKPKSPEFMDLIGRVGTDSAKQQTFILKKESLVEYGKATNSNTVTAIVISNINFGDNDFSYRLKEDIFIVDTESNKYISNVVYDTGNKMKRQDGIDFLMNKIQNEFKLP
jgi:hypothetical protein